MDKYVLNSTSGYHKQEKSVYPCFLNG